MSVKVSAAELRAMSECGRYPALLARTCALGEAPHAIDYATLLADVLEQEVDDESEGSPRFRRMIEDGELGAAEALLDMGAGGSDDTALLQRERARWEGELRSRFRSVMGRLLLLEPAEDTSLRDLNCRVTELAQDQYLRRYRPGRVVEALDAIGRNLESIARSTAASLREELGRLRKVLEGRAGDRDLGAAVQRLASALDSEEMLPLAVRYAELARRAKDRQLSPQDIRALNTPPESSGRLVRTRASVLASLGGDADARAAIDQLGRLSFASEFEKDRTRDLLRALVPGSLGKFDTQTVADRLRRFLGISPSEHSRPQQSTIGAAFRLELENPRVPSLRKGDRMFRGGVQLLIPLRIDETTAPQVVRNAPQDSVKLLYCPWGLRANPRRGSLGAEMVATFDNVDLLRIAESPIEKRSHAFQQVILPRLPLNRVRPYQAGGPVQPEMFRGRREIIERLKRPKGGTILFSGRMMGKSSILTKIHQDIQADSRVDGAPQQFGVFISNATEDLVGPLVEKLCACLPAVEKKKFEDADRQNHDAPGLRPNQRTERVRKRLANLRAIVTAILRSGRLTILIDEADRFAARDARLPRDESLAWVLRDLEIENPDNLRIVFAGFQTIHRQVIFENGAFANWFGMETLGPLDQEDAAALVREPFADLGFIFASDAGVSRICEFTARHPLLIHEVCARVIDRVDARRGDSLEEEEIVVEAGDVESVCREDQLRDRVRQVLSLNLNDYPRLKLMVYLILYAGAAEGGRSIDLDSFRLEDLRNLLSDYFGSQFNEYFGERSIGALVEELRSLGLVSRQADSYSFANRTFAGMLTEDRQFSDELARLFGVVTDPDRADERRFPTLPTESFERLVHPDTGHVCVIGLPKTMRSTIAKECFSQQQSHVVLEVGGCRAMEDLRERLRAQFKETRKTLSFADLLIKNNVKTVVLDQADDAAASGVLGAVIAELEARRVRMVAFGGAPLARCYAGELAALDVHPICLSRLRSQDIKAWAEGEGDPQIILDSGARSALRASTGGYFPLLVEFRTFAARNLRRSNEKEILPKPEDVLAFQRELRASVIDETLLGAISPLERRLLESLFRQARENGTEVFEWEFVDQIVIEALVGEDAKIRWLDRLEVLYLLDLIQDGTEGDRRVIRIDTKGPLRLVFQ